MNFTPFNPRVPGEQDGFTYVDKKICVHPDYHRYDRISITIAPGTGDLDAGTILGVTTADNLFRPVRRAAMTAAVAVGATTATVPNAAMYNDGDTVALCKADGTGVFAAGTVTAVNTNTNVVTFTTATTGAFAVGDFLYVADGSQTAVVILDSVVLDSSYNKIADAYVAGKFYLSTLVGVDSLVLNNLKARTVPLGLTEAGDAESMLII